MKLAILTAAALTLGACTEYAQPICNRDAIAWDKWGDVTAMADNCLPTSPRPQIAPVVASGEPSDPTPPTINPPTVTPPHEPPTTPEKPERVKSNASNHANERAGNNNGKGGQDRDTSRNNDRGTHGGRSS